MWEPRTWTTEEIIVLVYFCSRRVSYDSVLALIRIKCNPTRGCSRPHGEREQCQRVLRNINHREGSKGRLYCLHDTYKDWDIIATDAFLMRQTTDTALFDRLTKVGAEEAEIIIAVGFPIELLLSAGLNSIL